MHSAAEGLQNGEYAFIMFEFSAETVKNYLQRQFKWFFGSFVETMFLTDEARKAYQSVLLLAVKPPTEESYSNFTKTLKERISGPPFYSKEYEGQIINKSKSLTDVS